MEPEDHSAARYESGTGELKDVAVFLESAFEADGMSGSFCRGAASAAFRSGKQDAPPIGAFESHGAIAFSLRIRDADSFDAMAAAEAGHLGGSSLHHATHADAALVEFGKGLAQLRECFRVEGSAKMAEPENERGACGPEFGEPVRFAGRG
jgi:hypothetical protein